MMIVGHHECTWHEVAISCLASTNLAASEFAQPALNSVALANVMTNIL
jgi:hypothetical protein